MKKVIGILALVALTGNIASAELLKNFKYNGSIEAQGALVNNANDFNKDAGDKFGEVNNRVMVNASFDLNNDVSANVTATKCNRQAGDPAEKANTLIDQVQFEEAYLNLKGVFGVDHKIGRQYYGNDGDIVAYFGPANWYTRYLNAFNVAIDGWYADWKKDKWTATAMIAKFDEDTTAATITNVTPNGNNDQDIYALTVAYDYSEIVKPSLYYYNGKDYSAAKVDDTQVLGVKANGKYMGMEYGAEYAMNMGMNRNLTSTTNKEYKGSAMKFNAAYGLDLMGKLNVMGEYAMGTGDKNTTDSSDKSFQDINANYRPGLIAGGFGVNAGGFNPTGLQNLTTWNIGAKWNPSKIEKLELCAKYYDFSFTEKVGTVDHVGTEADLVATWNHSENVAFKAGLAMFMPDKYKIGTKDDSVNLGSLYMNVKF
ncbi:MAG: alginate export family protein [Elusimicrobiales bacterium]|nr:alginate export family protein [Elusimicrobiales bacterium]